MEKVIYKHTSYSANGDPMESMIELSPWSLARSLTPGNFSELLDEYLNTGMKDYRDGVVVGEKCRSAHRTIQGCVIRFCLGVIVGLSKQDYTDDRNKMPVEMAKKISQLVDDGELKMGWMI